MDTSDDDDWRPLGEAATGPGFGFDPVVTPEEIEQRNAATIRNSR
jgi:hypothetical protein